MWHPGQASKHPLPHQGNTGVLMEPWGILGGAQPLTAVYGCGHMCVQMHLCALW